ncbi:zinc finger protein basonuclin-1-like [Xiphophorus maculatus]|uniref:zinc finger protein basonuclin-1-like n=1 Tax=Xiphophorus maculatus TaxID=8083 RepID=UPI000C6C8BEB|nr:zinc finger protein basonuclin-1-like [Xiphophorus maculatus]
MRMTPNAQESVRCGASSCSCACFKPGKVKLRSCDRCGHGWVEHALEKVQARPASGSGPVEVALPGPVFDLSSLVLFGAQAVPVQLKILLDRLYSVLPPEQVGQILNSLGWSLGDYVRGYMLQVNPTSPVKSSENGHKVLTFYQTSYLKRPETFLDPLCKLNETKAVYFIHNLIVKHRFSVQILKGSTDPGFMRSSPSFKVTGFISRVESELLFLQRPDGGVLERWDTATPREQLLLLRQFLRFGETRPIVEVMILQHLEGEEIQPDQQPNAPVKNIQSGSNNRASGLRLGSLRDGRLAESNAASGNGPAGQSALLPFHFPQSGVYRSAKETFPSTELQNVLQDFRKNKLVQKHDRHRCEEDDDSERQRSEPALAIKTDPDKPNPSPWQQNPILHQDRVFLQKRFLSSSSFNFSLPPSSLVCSPLPSSSSSRLQPPPTLPSFSSSFLRPLRSFSSPLLPVTSPCSSLHPLPSSLCSFPSLLAAGGRKGRVSCGVCGKSFYDKGTLKIHYNAVHLKIKHRCTVLGCAMVFSSLRSRNRHSANPNPRLHTAGSRESQPYRNTLSGQSGQEKQETQGSRNHDSSHSPPQEAASPAPPLIPPAPPSGGIWPSGGSWPSGGIWPSGGSPSSLTNLQTGQQWWRGNQSLPQKKKPRKSSMPLKIERETTQSSKHEGES